MHSRLMERTGVFSVLRPNDTFRRVDAENNPAVLAFCKYSVQFAHGGYNP